MRQSLSLLLASAMALLLMGCDSDWTSGGGVDSWSDSFNWVSFSGVYTGIGGGVLITDYSTTPGGSGTTNAVTRANVGVANGSNAAGGSLQTPIVAGTVTIEIGNLTFRDNGTGTLEGSSGMGGTVDYSTGTFTVDFGGSPPNAGTVIYASYSFTVSGSQGTGAASPGTSGIVIYTFVVTQSGQLLTLTDNNGNVYSGSFGAISSTGSANQNNQNTPVAGDAVTGSFEVTGTSGAGYAVTMVGTFQGVVGSAGAGLMLANRQVFGTWIESGGRTGNIGGETQPIAISTGTGGTADTTTTTDTTAAQL